MDFLPNPIAAFALFLLTLARHGSVLHVGRLGTCVDLAVTMKGVVLVDGDLKTPSEWGIMDGVELLELDGYISVPAKLPDTPISFEDWTQMVLDSYAFRIVR